LPENTSNTSRPRGFFWPFSVVLTGVVIIGLVLGAPGSSPAAAFPEATSQEQAENTATPENYPITQTAIVAAAQTGTAQKIEETKISRQETAEAKALENTSAAQTATAQYPLVRTREALEATNQVVQTAARETATVEAATNQAATQTAKVASPTPVPDAPTPTDTPTSGPTPDATASSTPTKEAEPEGTTPPAARASDADEAPTPTLPPTSTTIPTDTMLLTNGVERVCPPGRGFQIMGQDAPPLTSLLLSFDGEIVGGGISDIGGYYRMHLMIGTEYSGSHRVEVLVRGSREMVLYFTCLVVEPTKTPTITPAVSDE
jgi:hypothetical protein